MNDVLKCFSNIYKVIRKNNYIIIYNNLGKYLIRKSNSQLDYSLPVIGKYNDYDICEYYDDLINDNEKVKRIVLLLDRIHLNKCKYLNEEEYEIIYKNINNKINIIMEYYLKLQDKLECFLYPRIDYLLLLENISLFYKILNICKEKNEYWYSLKNKKIRKTLCINNVNLDNFICNDKDYIIDYSECTNDLIIIDYVKLYRNIDYDINIDFSLEEFNLFLTYISLPSIIKLSNNIKNNVFIIKNEINYIKRVLNYILKQDENNQETDKNKFKE